MAAVVEGGESGRQREDGTEVGEVSMSDRIRWKRGGLLFRAEPKAEVDEELAFHLEERMRAYVERGMDPDAARAAALERLGDLRRVRSDCTELLSEERRAEARRDRLSDLRQDLRFAVRYAVRAPLFSFLAVLTLALGIGANSAVFGVLKSVLLDPLPYGDAERLVRIYGHFLDRADERGPLSAGMISDITQRQRSFAQLGAFISGPREAVFAGAEGPEAVQVMWVEPRLFETLGVQPALGRGLIDEDAAHDTAHVVMLTHAAWQRRFGAARDVVGRTVRINDIPREIVGVLPSDFVGPVGAADFYFALNLAPSLSDPIGARGAHWLGLVGRLAPGVTLESAERELSALGVVLAREYPRDNASIRLAAVPLRAALVGDTRTPLLVLMVSAGLVLLIACANLAAALLSRTISRRKEFAVRVSLGAGRGRLVRQLLTESTLLALFGGAVAVLLAILGLHAIRALALPALPSYAEFALDRGAVAVTCLLALCTGVAFGLAPAVSVSRVDPQRTLRDESRGGGLGRHANRLRGVLVASQVALCLSLLAGAGLLARSLWAMASAPLGFNPDSVLSVTIPLSGQRYATPESQQLFNRQFIERLRALPGVTGVAITNFLPTRVMNRNGLTIAGSPWPSGAAQPFVLTLNVSEDYFRTMGIPLRSGRIFGPSDRSDGPRVVVISESMARRYWPRGNALGARIGIGPDPNAAGMEVVGIVGDVRNDLAQPEPEPLLYMSLWQGRWGSTYVIRTAGDPLALINTVRRELAAADASLPLNNVTTLNGVLAEGLSGRRLPVLLVSAFGALALLLAAIGVYAMFASMAGAREHEFGLRRALGSSRRAIAGLVLRQGAFWMAAGLIGGAAGVMVVARLLRNRLYGTGPLDIVALGSAVAALLLCATVALLVPLRRATRVDPIAVMR